MDSHPPADLRLRILLAEDDPENQRFAARVLEAAGFHVQIAADGRAAVAQAARTRYDLVLMDVQMPELDGIAATEAIRSDERQTRDEPVPILAFSANLSADLEQQCRDAGMNDCLAKPIASHDMVAVVNKWVDRRHAILVVDDAREIRELVSRRLRRTFRVVQSVNGRDALSQFDRQPISLVLLDMNMPVLDGYATAAAIRQRDDGRQVPIVALTGDEGVEAQERAVAAGCTVHLPKPVRLETLLATVHAVMRPTRANDAASHPRESGRESGDVQFEINPLLADLVPGYVREKRRQLTDLKRFVAEGTLEQVRRIAHDLKGTGSAYGIPDISRIGGHLETAARQGDAATSAILVDELEVMLVRAQEQLGG